MKTTSLSLSKKLAALNLGVESEYVWRGKYTGSGSPQYPYQFLHEHYLGTYGKEEYQGNPKDNDYPAYTLHELLPVLKALGKKKDWSHMEVGKIGNYVCEYQYHWITICNLYAQSESLEGEVERYIEELI